jgi:Mor family transcriptional regulator
MVLASILLHNMMVKERIGDDEVEDGALYDTTMDANSNEEDEQVTEEVSDRNDVEYNSYDKNIIDRRDKAQLVHKRWEELYDNIGSKKLKDAMKRHLYKNKFGQEAFQSSHTVMKDYNPLSF